MAFKPNDALIGIQPLTDHVTTAQHALGHIITAKDPTYGIGEFIYLVGVASTVAGSIVSYDAAGTLAFQSALHTTELDKPRPVAVAMSACVAGEKGWYQISGIAVALKANTVSFAAGAGLGATAGSAVAVATGVILNGALVAIVASAKSDVTSVRVMISRPHGPSDVS